MILNFHDIPKSEFSVKACSELYDDFIAQYEQVPDTIHVKAWQQLILKGGFTGDEITWRGVPLEIK